ncbi:uncharacterized protein B0I36DRAFT_149907 [Microdochium trichocladiopsis]|uniref:Uncharacterized protein n=1 Tax=Microdochium trichocladiopsis TaxID=1682393 RepID=A0A9P9BM28_9PEZI|nr:uncharacterized protein B0I36DRAFT_149907 [Microdochium trichocladiopsis]KAH7025855.1 hypothetical protein B0I36DRAFT_149907 [Microdochium trichocladiopsis]
MPRKPISSRELPASWIVAFAGAASPVVTCPQPLFVSISTKLSDDKAHIGTLVWSPSAWLGCLTWWPLPASRRPVAFNGRRQRKPRTGLAPLGKRATVASASAPAALIGMRWTSGSTPGRRMCAQTQALPLNWRLCGAIKCPRSSGPKSHRLNGKLCFSYHHSSQQL